MTSRWGKFALAAGAAAIAGSLLTLEIYFNHRASSPDSVDVMEIAIPQYGRAAMWALLAPLILLLREKMPPSRGRWVGGVTFHLAMSFGVMATYYLGRMWSYQLLNPETGADGFWTMAAAGFYGRNIIDMAYYWAVLAGGYALEIRQKYKNEELKASQLETRLIETELKALRQQMHPHFLFNTMNTIAVLVREGRNDDAVSLVARLSALLRMSLDNTGVSEVTLQQELDFLSLYVEIQRTRFSDRLSVTIDVDPAARRARVPNLLLQPLVENAIIHGVAPKHGPGQVTVTGRVEDDRLRLEVRDDGPGLSEGHKRKKEGVGLANTRERLVKIYGTRSQLLLHSEPGRGVAVQIVLPFRV